MRYLIYNPRAFKLFQASLHFCKGGKYGLSLLHLFLIVPEKLQGSLEDFPRFIGPLPVLLGFSPLDPYPWFGSYGDPSLIDCTCPIQFTVPLLHFDVGLPRLVIWLPLHPALEHLPRTRHILEEFLEIDILVPELVDAREQGDCAIKEIACVLDVARLELHFGVARTFGVTFAMIV